MRGLRRSANEIILRKVAPSASNPLVKCLADGFTSTVGDGCCTASAGDASPAARHRQLGGSMLAPAALELAAGAPELDEALAVWRLIGS